MYGKFTTVFPPTTLERDGYTLKIFRDLYLTPRPDSGLGLSKEQ